MLPTISLQKFTNFLDKQRTILLCFVDQDYSGPWYTIKIFNRLKVSIRVEHLLRLNLKNSSICFHVKFLTFNLSSKCYREEIRKTFIIEIFICHLSGLWLFFDWVIQIFGQLTSIKQFDSFSSWELCLLVIPIRIWT